MNSEDRERERVRLENVLREFPVDFSYLLQTYRDEGILDLAPIFEYAERSRQQREERQRRAVSKNSRSLWRGGGSKL